MTTLKPHCFIRNNTFSSELLLCWGIPLLYCSAIKCLKLQLITQSCRYSLKSIRQFVIYILIALKTYFRNITVIKKK